MDFQIEANLIDIIEKNIRPVRLHVSKQKIAKIEPLNKQFETYILPGFVDAHVHIESSLLIPSEFARMAVIHGTVATVSDPHEIANVCGMEGIEFMIQNAQKVPFKICYGAPSCVPATQFETAGANINAEDIERLMQYDSIYYLAEMMNFPGLLNEDPEIIQKIRSAIKHQKPIDGHAPGLRAEAALAYFKHGISTDHECFTYEEALEKIGLGVQILIREGSAAKNFNALHPLITNFAEQLMFCSDDKHPDSLEIGHINQLVKRALHLGYNLFDVLQMACINPVLHYHLPVGLLKVGDPADFIQIDNPTQFNILATYINGQCVAKNGQTLIESVKEEPINQFQSRKIGLDEIQISAQNSYSVIECMDGELITNNLTIEHADCTLENDVVMLSITNRYNASKVVTCYLKGTGLKMGAIASTVAHDSHNLIAMGTNAEDIQQAMQALMDQKGGLAVSNKDYLDVLPLPFAGLMSGADAYQTTQKYKHLDNYTKQNLGASLGSPFMTLSFMALLVIPALKLSDLGLFDGKQFQFID
jgi:adenine deaminase